MLDFSLSIIDTKTETQMLAGILLLAFGYCGLVFFCIFMEWAFKSLMASYGALIYAFVFIWAITWIHTAFFNS